MKIKANEIELALFKDNALPQMPALQGADKDEAFRKLIEGEYKDQYTKSFQKVFDRRFKKERERLERQQPVLDAVAARFNLEPDDLEAMLEALQRENAQAPDKANAAALLSPAGASLEEAPSKIPMAQKPDVGAEGMQRLPPAENTQPDGEAPKTALQGAGAKPHIPARLPQRGKRPAVSDGASVGRELNRLLRDRAADAKLRRWQNDAEKMKGENADFDMEKESQNPDFMRLLRADVPLNTAYKALHLEELIEKAEQNALSKAEKTVLDNIRARGARATENGVSAQSGITVRPDISRMTPAQREEIARRALNGEKVRL